MSGVVRFGVSLDSDLLQNFDKHIKVKKYTNRSEAIRDLIREELIKQEWQENKEVTGAIVLVYNHHKRELANWLIDVQHHYFNCILSSQHIHLDEDNCLEIIAVYGIAERIKELYEKLKAKKGVKHTSFTEATTGKKVD